ncbi:GNAT family N-acetyltransferase [Halothiobacillus diazotrophicus]|uniref:GNAT family N-acetyltransferase n=1 Tax=Halothiobacillus diazotrophicus TaxID=1860122 RepID=UPI0009EE2A19|nr:GNAT family N-acyltransferase [Halothiobacillus diazotrophicus]
MPYTVDQSELIHADQTKRVDGIDAGHRLQVGLAVTPDEIRATFALRHRVFVEELGAKIPPHAPKGIESDDLDAYCHHLVVHDLDTGDVVACTRILTDTQAKVAGGFYSANEFDLSAIEHIHGRVMEIGRTCVHPDYRNGATIGTLWTGLAQFMEINRFAYLMGCASISMNDGGLLARQILSQMSHKFALPTGLEITTKRGLPPLASNRLAQGDLKIPPLLKAYLRLGACMGSEAYWDEDFNTADVFIWLDRAKLQQRYLRHFVQRKDTPRSDRYLGRFAA